MKRYIIFLLFASYLLELTSSFSASSAAKPSPSLSRTKDIIQLNPDTANDVLYNLLSTKDDSTIILQGLVTKRRAIGKSLVFLDIIPLDIPDIQSCNKEKKSKKNTRYDEIETITPVQAILKRDCWNKLIDDNTNTTSSSTYDIYHKIIQPGVHVQLLGEAGPSRNAQEAILFLHSVNISLVNDNPQHVRNILRYAAADSATEESETLDIDEVVNALPWITKEELISLTGRDDSTTNQGSFYDIAVDILNKAPRNYLYNPSKLMGSTNSQKVKLLPPSPLEYIKVPSSIVNDGNVANKSQEVTTISNVLKQQNQTSDDDQYTQFTITGWVQNRRRYQGAISILELVDEFSSLTASSNDKCDNDYIEGPKLKDLWKDRIYAVLHPDALDNNNNTDTTTSGIELSERYGNILCTGARVLLQGYMSSSSTTKGAPTFWATSCTLLRSSWRLNTVRYVLDLLHEGKLDIEEASSALELQYSQGENISMGTTSATERQWLAAELTQTLQGDNSRIGKISDEMKNSLKTFAYARESYPTEQISNKPEIDVSTGPSTNLEGSRWERAKKPQLQLMIEQIAIVLRSHPEYGQRVLKVVDIGGGRGLLSNFLAETFGDSVIDCRVFDISKSAISNGRMRARRQGIQNIKFEARDATTLPFDDVDIVVALHACGVLSDVALGHATCQGVGFVICPCCFKSNPHLKVSIPTEEPSATKLVTAEEFLGVDPSEYEHLKHLAGKS